MARPVRPRELTVLESTAGAPTAPMLHEQGNRQLAKTAPPVRHLGLGCQHGWCHCFWAAGSRAVRRPPHRQDLASGHASGLLGPGVCVPAPPPTPPSAFAVYWAACRRAALAWKGPRCRWRIPRSAQLADESEPTRDSLLDVVGAGCPVQIPRFPSVQGQYLTWSQPRCKLARWG